MGTNNITIQICNSIEEAPNYNNLPGWHAAEVTKAIIVRNGTVNGNDTIDLQFKDLEGKNYSCMITAALFKQIAALANTH